MTLTIRAIDTSREIDFGGEVLGADLTRAQTPAEIAAIEAGMDRFGVLVFRGQELDDALQIAFSLNFGPLELATGDIVQGAERRLRNEVNDISNLDRDNRVRAQDDRARLFGLGNMLWHSDSSFKPVPAKYSLLSARVIPDSGGNTEFADMRAAWDALGDDMKATVHDLVAAHSQLYSRGSLGFADFSDDELSKWVPVPQPLVRPHPVTGRKALFLSAHAGAIQGWPVPEARMLLRDLTEFATDRRFVHVHQWRRWDLVMWDNRVTMHRARRFPADQVRDMHRTTIANVGPTPQQTLQGTRS